MEEQSFSLGVVAGILRRRMRLMIAVAGSIILLSIFVAAILRSEYTVYTTILVEPQSISKKLVETGEEKANVMNRLHLMTMQILSRARLSKVIDDLKLYQKESESKTREEVIDLMRSRINVEPVLPEINDPDLKRRMDIDVNTFRLYFRHDNAGIAAAVANRLSNDFIDEHIKERVQSSGDTADFVDSELQRLSTRLRDLEGQIAQVKGQNAGSLPDDVFTNQRQIEDAFQQLSLASQRLAEAQSDEAFYKQQATVARESGINNGPQNTAVISPNQRLQQLENEISEMRGRGLTDRHPDMIATLAEIEQVRSRIKNSDADDPEKAAPQSVAEQQARAEAQRAALRVESAEKEVARLQGEMTKGQERLANTPRVAEQLDALQREYGQLGDSFKNMSDKRLDAAVAANMERRQKGEQFRVLEPAYAPPDPTSPNRPVIIALGFMLGIGAAAGLALLLDASDSSYHDSRQLQSTLRIPVLTAIPSILLDPDRMRIRRRNIRDAFAAMVVSGAVLASSAAGYVFVNHPAWIGLGQQTEEEEAAPAAAAPAAPTPAAAPTAAAPAVPGAAPQTAAAPAAAPVPDRSGEDN
jgi:polysaccharide chain length determinant protein (PEP-CTERM system associated)